MKKYTLLAALLTVAACTSNPNTPPLPVRMAGTPAVEAWQTQRLSSNPDFRNMSEANQQLEIAKVTGDPQALGRYIDLKMLDTAVAKCNGKKYDLPNEDFYNFAGRDISNTNRFFACIRKQTLYPAVLNALNLQESLWIQVIKQKKPPEQATQEYLTFVQQMMINTAANSAQDTSAVAPQFIGGSIKPFDPAYTDQLDSGQQVYSPSECIGPIVNGECHGSILPNTAYHQTCHGQMLGGQCTGPMF